VLALHPQRVEEMTEEEAAEVKLIYAAAWPDEGIPIEEIRRGDDAELPEAWKTFDDGTPQPDWVALVREAPHGR
jgi:hypothetical protein